MAHLQGIGLVSKEVVEKLALFRFQQILERTSAVDNLDALKRYWEVCLNIHRAVGGGKGENPDADWQRVLDFLMPSEDEDEGEDRDEGEDEVEGEDGDKNND